MFSLRLELGFHWPYYEGRKGLNSSLKVFLKDDTLLNTPCYGIKKIYPNNNYQVICAKVGNAMSNDGVTLYFDTFEDLNSISRIVCIWAVEENGECLHRGHYSYGISGFEEGHRHYWLHRNETPFDIFLEAIKNNSRMYKRHLDDYHAVLRAYRDYATFLKNENYDKERKEAMTFRVQLETLCMENLCHSCVTDDQSLVIESMWGDFVLTKDPTKD